MRYALIDQITVLVLGVYVCFLLGVKERGVMTRQGMPSNTCGLYKSRHESSAFTRSADAIAMRQGMKSMRRITEKNCIEKCIPSSRYKSSELLYLNCSNRLLFHYRSVPIVRGIVTWFMRFRNLDDVCLWITKFPIVSAEWGRRQTLFVIK